MLRTVVRVAPLASGRCSKSTIASSSARPRAMAYRAAPTDLPMKLFESAAGFETFLDANQETAPGLYLKIAKKASGLTSISAEDAVEVALCFGWIDGWGCGLDDQWSCKRFTPRRAKSVWSQKNTETVARLIAAGRMRPSGLDVVNAAKADGRWERTYGGSASKTLPKELETALDADPVAREAFEGLSKSARYSAVWHVQTATPTNLAKRIDTLMRSLRDPAAAKVKGKQGKSRRTTIKKASQAPSVSATVVNEKPKSSTKITTPSRPTRRPGLRPRS